MSAPHWSDDVALRDLLGELGLLIAQDTRFNVEFEIFIARQDGDVRQLAQSLELNQERTRRLALLFHIIRTLGDDEDVLRALYRRALGSQRGQVAA